jgi:ABC-2 type transport system ATP-binding protein
MQAVIETSKLRRRFGPAIAVDGIDLLVPESSIYGFLGPNGAGKTTTIRMLTGLLRPTSGTITILGRSMPSDRLRIARQIGALVETPSLYDHLTGRENLELTRLLLGLKRSAVDRSLELADLERAGDLRVAAYSLGMRQRLALARALLGEPRLLILDEPGNGLDPDGIRDLRNMLRALAAEGITILVSSHQLAEVQQIASHIGVMHAGRLLAQGPLDRVMSDALSRIEVRTSQGVQAELLLLSLGSTVRREGDLLVLESSDPETAVPELISRLFGAGVTITEVRCCAPTLEDLYVHLTGGGSAVGRSTALAS